MTESHIHNINPSQQEWLGTGATGAEIETTGEVEAKGTASATTTATVGLEAATPAYSTDPDTDSMGGTTVRIAIITRPITRTTIFTTRIATKVTSGGIGSTISTARRLTRRIAQNRTCQMPNSSTRVDFPQPRMTFSPCFVPRPCRTATSCASAPTVPKTRRTWTGSERGTGGCGAC